MRECLPPPIRSGRSSVRSRAGWSPRGSASSRRCSSGSSGSRSRPPCSASSARRGSSTSPGSCRGSRAPSRGRARSPGSSRALPPGARGRLIGRAFAAAVAGALFGPVLGGLATVAGTGPTFGAVAALSLGLAVLAVLTPASRPDEPQPLSRLGAAVRDRRILLPVWFVLLPALLFGTLGVLGPLRLSALGAGAIGIGAVWLTAGVLETLNNLVIGQGLRSARPTRADSRRSRRDDRRHDRPAAARERLRPRARDPRGRDRLRHLLHAGNGSAHPTRPRLAASTTVTPSRSCNLAWAPGQTIGSALGGSIAEATSDAVPYYILSGLALVTLVALGRSHAASGSRLAEQAR